MFKSEIASVEDRDELVAELWWDDHQVAELSQDGGRLRLQLYKAGTGKCWDFDYIEFAQAIAGLAERLKGTDK